MTKNKFRTNQAHLTLNIQYSISYAYHTQVSLIKSGITKDITTTSVSNMYTNGSLSSKYTKLLIESYKSLLHIVYK